MKHPGLVNTVINNDINFEWSKENFTKIEQIIKKYPPFKQQSAVIPLLDIAQRQNDGWLSKQAIEKVAETLNMSFIRVMEIATFYSMYNLFPVGKYFIQVCTTTPCMIRGSNKIVNICKQYISKNQNELSENKICSWTEVECLGACVNAPMFQVNDDFFEDLNEEKTKKIILSLLENKYPEPDLLNTRKNSAPEKNRKTLLGIKNA